MVKENLKILAYINTYNRYDSTLSMALLSMIMQTRKPDHIRIYDDNKEPRDLREAEHFKYLFDLMTQKGIEWDYVFAQKKGAHFSHELANTSGYDLAWFLDDDQVAEANCLEELEKQMADNVGCVGGLILKPPVGKLISGLDGSLNDIWKGQNIAWYQWDKDSQPIEAEHLYSSFLYRCGIVHHDLRLSKKVFRGETMFTHSFFLKGYKLIITPKAITWHFEGQGGCRTPEEEKTNQEMYDSDHAIFIKWLGIANKPIFILDNGLGDHIVFRKLLDNLGIKDILIACCYEEVFEGYNIISIAEAKNRGYNMDDHDLYGWMANQNWKGTLYDAYTKFYEKNITTSTI